MDETDNTIKILGDLPKGVCISCGTYKMARIRIEKFVEGFDNSIREISWKMNCFDCSQMFKKLKKYDEEIAKLEKKKLDEKFDLFKRQFNN